MSNKFVIKAVGVGGAGCNIIEYVVENGNKDIELFIADSCEATLNSVKVPNKILLGKRLLKGKTTALNTSKGEAAAKESYDEIRDALSKADMVFIIVGLGGGAGTGGAVTIAKAAKDIGALTITIATQPFQFEGRKRMEIAQRGLKKLQKISDSVILISNDVIVESLKKAPDLGIAAQFKIMDKILTQTMGVISNINIDPKKKDIYFDFNDIKLVMDFKGFSVIGVGEAEGEDSALKAVKEAANSSLLGGRSIQEAKGLLVHFKIHPDYSIFNISSAMESLDEIVDEDTHLVFSTTTDETMPEDKAIITIIAIGFRE